MKHFIHLHNHTHYSLQDAACTVDQLVEAAVRYDMPSVALTDHGVMYGISEFYKKAVQAGIKPIIGMEAYITVEGDRHQKTVKQDPKTGKRKKQYHHLILLAKNDKGYHNLLKLTSQGFLEGFYYRPRIDLELLKEHHEGLICTSACLGGVVSAPLIGGNYDLAKRTAAEYKEIFGEDFYLEIQDHKLREDLTILEGVPKIGKELGIKIVGTNDVHYINREDAVAHNILLLFGDKTGEADYKNLRYRTDEIYFKSSEEMIDLFKDFPEAVESTLEIDSKIDLKLQFGDYHFPQFPIPEDSEAKNLDDYFKLLAREGLEEKYGDKLTPEIEERFNFEIKVITEMGFSGYFLIVQDFINAAKEMNIPVGPGRGSAAGSLVSYVLGITNIDPLEYNLLFERFLNPARNSMPDIDVDFADDQRSEVIEYVKKRYGSESVCQIITFNRLSSKAVIRDVARVLGIPIPTVNNITKHIPSTFGKVYSIAKALKEVPELRWVRESTDPQIQDLIKYGKSLEGMNRNMSKHAAGVVITPGPVSEFVPLAVASTVQQEVVTQYNMKELDDAGLLKMDFLGLRTLTIIRDTLDIIKEEHGVEIDIDKISLDDEKTFALFARGQTTGIFQFESGPMREYLKQLKPKSVKDLSAMNALYRPGPMDFIDDFIAKRFGRQPVTFTDPKLEPILKETYGIIVYQEQVIQIANKLGGMSLAEADILRRAMGKKDEEAMLRQEKKFITGAVENGIPQKKAVEIFAMIKKFAKYGFNKSHAVAYSFLAYQTAFLKAHYPTEFLTSNMTNEFGNQEKVAAYLEDCRKLNIDVLTPDVNNPAVYFEVENHKIRFGLAAIKNVGVKAVEEIKRGKQKLGRDFTSIYDFCSNVDTHIVNKRSLEGLILAGAFDSVHPNRKELYLSVHKAIEFGTNLQQYEKKMENSLFGEVEEEEAIPEPELEKTDDWTDKEKLSQEREVTGFYMSGHPISKYEIEARSFATIMLGETEHLDGDSAVRACGVITDLNTKMDRKGNEMAFFKLNGLTGSCECIMFASSYGKSGKYVVQDEPVLIIGTAESTGDTIKLNIQEVMPIEESRNRFAKYMKIVIDRNEVSEKDVGSLKDIFKNYPGSVQIVLELNDSGGSRVFRLPQKVSPDPAMIEQIKTTFGRDAVRFIPKE